jgi:hypothetical protein
VRGSGGDLLVLRGDSKLLLLLLLRRDSSLLPGSL